MRRVKREKSERAYSRGYQAGIQNRPKESCPYATKLNTGQSWIMGWRDGRSDQLEGFIGISGLHKMAKTL